MKADLTLFKHCNFCVVVIVAVNTQTVQTYQDTNTTHLNSAFLYEGYLNVLQTIHHS